MLRINYSEIDIIRIELFYMGKNLGFRGWYYFRQGWSLYFAFIFAAINTLTVTYFLAIERVPFLTTIFPSFIHYVVIISSVAIPILILVGYVHWKKSAARKAEIDILYETDPYKARTLVNTEMLLKMNFNLTLMINKMLNDQKPSKEELLELQKSQDKISKFITDRTFGNKIDLCESSHSWDEELSTLLPSDSPPLTVSGWVSCDQTNMQNILRWDF